MKFLLTSSGITNKSIAGAILELVQLPANKINVAFIPTAADRYPGDKSWLIDDMDQFAAQGYRQVDIVPIAAISKTESLARLKEAHLICFGGGSEYRLIKVLRDTGLDKELPKLLATRVHVGISAGSNFVGYDLKKDFMNWLYVEDQILERYEKSYGWVDAIVIPHFNSSYMTRLRKNNLEPLRGKISHPLYAIDDASALKVVDGKIEIVGEGKPLVIE